MKTKKHILILLAFLLISELTLLTIPNSMAAHGGAEVLSENSQLKHARVKRGSVSGSHKNLREANAIKDNEHTTNDNVAGKSVDSSPERLRDVNATQYNVNEIESNAGTTKSQAIKSNEPTKNITTNSAPLILYGALNLGAEIGVKESLTIGPHLFFYKETVLGMVLKTTQIQFKTNFYLNGKRFKDGFVLSPYLTYYKFTANSEDSDTSASGYGVGGIIAYRLFWANGFNLGFGLGVIAYNTDGEQTSYSSKGKSKTIELAQSASNASLELTLGFAF